MARRAEVRPTGTGARQDQTSVALRQLLTVSDFGCSATLSAAICPIPKLTVPILLTLRPPWRDQLWLASSLGFRGVQVHM